MFAQILRKWSSLLMYLFQFYLILFSFRWTGAYAMHMTPSFNTYRSELARSAATTSSVVIANNINDNLNDINNNKNNNLNVATGSSSSSSSRSSTPLSNSHSSQFSGINNFSESSSSSRTDFLGQIVAAATEHQKFLQIPSHEEDRVASVKRWQQRMFEKRSRIREHRRQISQDWDNSGRSRRDSARRGLRGSSGGSGGGGKRFQPERKRYCSARDPSTLAFEAPTVFEGKVKSMSSDRRSNFSVTFEVVNKTKHHNGWELPRNVRLQFAYRNNTECDIYREEFRDRGFVKKPLELGKHYYLFVKQIDLGNFTILGVPLKKNNHTTRGVLKGVSDNYGNKAKIIAFKKEVVVDEGKKLKLVCKVDGQPPPKVTWFKDSKSINKSRSKYNFVHTRKKSELTVNETARNDAGSYECRVKNKFDKQTVSQFSQVIVKSQPFNGNISDISDTNYEPCSAHHNESFCYNGKCRWNPSLGDMSCVCPQGFAGVRCGDKIPDNVQTSTLQGKECNKDGLIGGYYC